jgi:hypothetical protein
MSAGMPGLGLGGMFFVLSALLAPVIEIPRMLRGETPDGTWREIGRNLVISLLIIAAVDCAMRFALLVAWLVGGGSTDRLTGLSVVPLGPLAFTGLLLATLLAAAKLVSLALGALDRLGIRRASRRRRLPHGPACPCCTD